MQNIENKSFTGTTGRVLIPTVFVLLVILSSSWLCMAVWIQQPGGGLLSGLIIAAWIIFALSILGIYFSQHFLSRSQNILLYVLFLATGMLWYVNIPAQQDRDWSPDVAKILSYERDGDLIQLHNVRNFDWQSENQFTERWETRQFDLDHITGINVIASYWMGPQIAHTLVSFDFADQKPLVFSIEIRKEKNESFSAIGGFFRQFELSLIAADEKDIVYTRSNIRKEQVYLFPIKMNKPAMKALFLEYLNTADQLRAQPKWYNTVSSNCTTIIFDIAQAIEGNQLPKDYRLLLSGYLPNYLYDLGVLNQKWNIKQWYQHAQINPRTANFQQLPDQSSAHFSALMRQGLSHETIAHE